MDDTNHNSINYIVENIDSVESTGDLINYIELNNINYSLNSNGYFVNISLLEKKHLDFFCEVIKNYKNSINIEKDIKYYQNNISFNKKEKEYPPIKLNELQSKMFEYI